jgi:hypothetical protein
MDRAGGWGKCRAQVDVISQGQTMQVALIPTPGGADPNRFGPPDFQVNAERTACTCPNGVVTTRLAPKRNADGLTARYLASDCRDCPFWTDCRGLDGKPKAQGSVFLTDHHAYLRQAAVFNPTPEGKALLARRWQDFGELSRAVEPTVAWLTRYQGCRRARCLGQDAAQGRWGHPRPQFCNTLKQGRAGMVNHVQGASVMLDCHPGRPAPSCSASSRRRRGAAGSPRGAG